jgi:hypothetical protein
LPRAGLEARLGRRLWGCAKLLGMHDWVIWVLVAASALHVVEEHALGWQGWATQNFARIGVHPTWTDF